MIYSGLQDAIRAYVNKPEIEQQIATFVLLAEAELNRSLRVRQMVSRATATIDEEFELMPTGFMGPRSIELQASPPYAVKYIDPDGLTDMKATHTTTGRPTHYTIVGGEFQFCPAPGASYSAQMTFWKAIPALSDSNTSNWLLAAYPDIYVYGSLVHAALFLSDDRLAIWKSQYANAVDALTRQDVSQSYGQGMQTRSGNAV